MTVHGAFMIGGGLSEAQFINAYQYNVVKGDTLVIPKPSVTVGDMLVLWTLNSSGVTDTPDAAFTLRKDVGSSVFGAIYTRTINGSEGSTFTFEADKPTGTYGAILAHMRSAAFDAVGNISNSSSTAQAPSITLSKKGKVLAVFGRSAGNNSFTTPAGFTASVKIMDPAVTGLSAALFVADFPAGATGVVASAASGGTSRGILFGAVAP